MIEAIRKAVEAMEPGALLVAIDAGRLHRQLLLPVDRDRGVRGEPVPHYRMADARTVHGNDERVSVENLRFGVEFMYRMVERVAR